MTLRPRGDCGEQAVEFLAARAASRQVRRHTRIGAGGSLAALGSVTMPGAVGGEGIAVD